MNDYDDYIVRVISKDFAVRALACVTTGIVADAARRHRSTPIATAALGYGLTAATLLGALLKNQQRVGLKVGGQGPLRKLVAESDSTGHVRGYVDVPDLAWPLPISAADVADALGRKGLLTVFRDLRLKEIYEGVVPIQTGEVDTDLVYYLTKSEQIPSLVEIGVKLDDQGELVIAGGVLVQLMPGQEVSTLTAFADRLLALLFAGVPHEILEQRPVEFRCSCTWDRSEQALRLLPVEDIEILLDEGQAVVDCHFCHERYVFGREVLEMIREEKTASGETGE
jgi:molecular chaperone Hsp33